jgi:hypothetical protein
VVALTPGWCGEWCEPGTRLWELPEDQAAVVAADVLVALRRTVPEDAPFEQLEAISRSWAKELQRTWERGNRPFERGASSTRPLLRCTELLHRA